MVLKKILAQKIAQSVPSPPLKNMIFPPLFFLVGIILNKRFTLFVFLVVAGAASFVQSCVQHTS